MLKVGIVGLPNVGKSTLFAALTKKQVDCANYPFCTIEPNVGIVEVPDSRIDTLSQMAKSENVIPTAIEFVDIAGLVKGAYKGEGLGNQFLANIRETDMIAHVVRAFEGDITHVDGSVDPMRDAEVIETELIMADLSTVEKRLDAVGRKARMSKDKDVLAEYSGLEKLKQTLEIGTFARMADLTKDEVDALKGLQLITQKRMIYIVNVNEEDAIDPNWQSPIPAEKGISIPISVKIEADLATMESEEADMFMEELGMKESGLDRVIRSAYEALGLITYFTVGPKETRAWTVRDGATAPQAAGVIHTDFEKGFIRAEVISYQDYVACDGESGARTAGKLRTEGKGYLVKDGDVMHFLFN